MHLHHVVSRVVWEAACQIGEYAPDALRTDGFLHCCTPAQLDFVLHRHFAGATDLLVLTFAADAVLSPVRWVESEPGLPPFPHLYGPIPCAAVRDALPV
jgi:uncharacterized protein (DUF952 family)